jgi:PAS domain S-box-containing protein
VCAPVPLFFAEQRYKLPMRLLTVAISIWAGAVALRISATTVSLETTWHTIRMLGPITAGWCFFLFSAEYTDREVWSTPTGLLLLSIVPGITLLIGATNAQHGLLRASIEASSGGAFLMEFTPGIWYYVHSVYSYLLVAVGLGWLLSKRAQSDTGIERRRQKVIMTFAAILVMSVNLAYNIDLTSLDWTPVAGAGWAIMLVLVAQRYRAFGLTPLAQKEIVEELDECVVTVDQSCEVVAANPAMEELACRPKEEFIGKEIDDALEVFETDIRELIESDASGTEIRTRENKYYSLSTSTITNVAGEVLGKTVSLADITEQVERERKLERQKTELEQKNRELKQKKQTLEQKNEKLDEFSKIVSHDLRNPLGVILGNARIIEDELSDSANAHDRVTNIIDTTQEMDQMIDDLLELARLGKDIQETTTASLATVADSAWQNVDLEQCELTVADDATIEASTSELMRVFENLYRNAREHNTGEIELQVGVSTPSDEHTTQDDTSELGIYVEDTGQGIPDADQAKIFERGYTNSDTGTGFGLSIVSDVVEAHGWEITVTDAANGGARFNITGIEGTARKKKEATA